MATPVKKVPIHLQSSQNRLLIKNGTVVNDNGDTHADVYIEDGVVKMVGSHLIIPGGTRVIDASDKLVLPGGVDASVHMHKPHAGPDGASTQTIDDFYSVTRAAVVGGTTTVMDCVWPAKGESLMNAYIKWRGWADEKVCCDYGLRMVVPVTGDKIDDATKSDMEELTSEQFGVNTFKMSLIGNGRLSNDDALLDALEYCKKIGGLMQLHAESGDLVARGEKNMAAKGITGPEGFAMAHTETAEEEAVMRAATLANQLTCPLYLGPITSSSAADVVKRKKSRGAVIFAETTAAALACDGNAYWNQCWRHAAGFVCEPPLRNGQREAILNGVVGDNDGVSFDTLASDSCTFNSKQKAIGKQDFTKIPTGVNGVEERMSVLWELAVHSGRMTPSQFVAATSSNAARLFNMYPTKGRIEVGADADVVIWNPRATKTLSAKTHQMKVDFNVFEMMECHGVAETVICQGRVVIDDGQMRVAGGFGKFLPLKPFAPHVFNKIKEKEESEAALAPRSVARTESDMAITNGSSCEIPPPTPPKSSQAERAPSQHVSNFDLRSHPNSADFEVASSRNSPLRSSVRVRAPPGGKSVGSFW